MNYSKNDLNLTQQAYPSTHLYSLVQQNSRERSKIAESATLACGAIGPAICGASVIKHINICLQDGDFVKATVNSSISVGCTVFVGAMACQLMGSLSGLCVGMAVGSLIGRWISDKNLLGK